MATLALRLPPFKHCPLCFCYFLPKVTLIDYMLQISFSASGGAKTQYLFVDLINM